MIGVADSLSKAYKIAEYTEFAAEVYYKAKLLGEPYLFSEHEVYESVRAFTGKGDLCTYNSGVQQGKVRE